MPRPLDPYAEARRLIELEILADRFHPRYAAQFAAGVAHREVRLALAQETARTRN